MEYRIEVNIARKGSEPTWHYLMEDDHSPCIFDTEQAARDVLAAENRGPDARLVRFLSTGIGIVVDTSSGD